MKKKEKESHPSIPSKNPKGKKRDDGGLTDDPSFEVVEGISMRKSELEACLKLKGTLEKVREAVEFIQKSPKRKNAITDWPKALASWTIESPAKERVKGNILYTENLCGEFSDYHHGRGWRCSMYNDARKDQRGILFENQSPHLQAFFVALADGKLQDKCEDFIKNKNMRQECTEFLTERNS